MSKINKLEEVRHLITMHCNLECLHCYLKGGGEKNCQKQNIIDEDILKILFKVSTKCSISNRRRTTS